MAPEPTVDLVWAVLFALGVAVLAICLVALAVYAVARAYHAAKNKSWKNAVQDFWASKERQK